MSVSPLVAQSAVPYLLVFVAGAALGSFLNVAVLRWSVGRSVLTPRSHCPLCQHPLGWADLVPLLGWLRLRGRCRHCGCAIAGHYVLVELVLALAACGFVSAALPPAAAVQGFVLLSLLFAIALSDARYYLIPDAFSLGGTALGLGFALWPGGRSASQALFGAALGYGMFRAAGWLTDALMRRFTPGRLEAALHEHDEVRGEPRQLARLTRLTRPGVRWAGVGVASLCTLWLALRVGNAGPGEPLQAFLLPRVAMALAASLASGAVVFAWVDSFGDPIFAPERAALEQAIFEQAAHGEHTTHPVEATSLGEGDLRTMALIGAFLGPEGVVVATLVGAVLALLAWVPISRALRQLIPFGVFLAAGGTVAWLLQLRPAPYF